MYEYVILGYLRSWIIFDTIKIRFGLLSKNFLNQNVYDIMKYQL